MGVGLTYRLGHGSTYVTIGHVLSIRKETAGKASGRFVHAILKFFRKQAVRQVLHEFTSGPAGVLYIYFTVALTPPPGSCRSTGKNSGWRSSNRVKAAMESPRSLGQLMGLIYLWQSHQMMNGKATSAGKLGVNCLPVCSRCGGKFT